MDPTETLRLLLEELALRGPPTKARRRRVLYHLDSLRDWIANDGFLPTVANYEDNTQ